MKSFFSRRVEAGEIVPHDAEQTVFFDAVIFVLQIVTQGCKLLPWLVRHYVRGHMAEPCHRLTDPLQASFDSRTCFFVFTEGFKVHAFRVAENRLHDDVLHEARNLLSPAVSFMTRPSEVSAACHPRQFSVVANRLAPRTRCEFLLPGRIHAAGRCRGRVSSAKKFQGRAFQLQAKFLCCFADTFKAALNRVIDYVAFFEGRFIIALSAASMLVMTEGNQPLHAIWLTQWQAQPSQVWQEYRPPTIQQ